MFHRFCVTCTQINFEKGIDVEHKIMQILKMSDFFGDKFCENYTFEAVHLKFDITDTHV